MVAETVRDAPPVGAPSVERWRRVITLVTSLLAFFSASAAGLLEYVKGDPDGFERFGLPVIAILGLAAAAFHRTSWREHLQLGLLAAAGAILLERVYKTLCEQLPGVEPYVNAYEVIAWFPLLYLFGFTLLPARRALGAALGLIAACGAVFWMALRDRPELAARLDVFEIGFANLGCVALILALSRLKEHWSASHAEATTLRRLAQTDYLTGLPNRREATTRVEREIQRCQRYGAPLALLLLDLDHFKTVNDRFGHAVGDQALVRAAGRIQATLRSTDVCGRWGGEEFLVALPGVELGGAVEAAERLRAALVRPAGEPGPALTASIGVTAHAPGESVDTLVQRADAALYEAKRAGRDRVTSIPAPAPLRAVERA